MLGINRIKLDGAVNASQTFISIPSAATASLGTPTGYAIAYDTTTGTVKFYNGSAWGAIDTSATPTIDQIDDAAANNTWAFAGYTNTWTSTLNGGSVFTISNSVADLTSDTYLVELKLTDDGDANGFFLRCLDNSGVDAKFLIGPDGQTTITNTGTTGYGLTITGGAAGSTGISYTCAASATGSGLLLDGSSGSSAWVGAANTGFLQISSDGTLASTSASLIRIAFSGTSASGGAGTCVRIVDTSTSGGGTEYAAYISSSNSEALHVDAGKVQFDEMITLGVDDTGADLKAFGATTGKYMLWDESADQLQLTNSTALVIGGSEGSNDGLTISFNGTATIAMNAVTANDAIVVGGSVSTDFTLTTANGTVTCDASADSVTFSASTHAYFTGTGTGKGLRIPSHATASPNAQDGAGNIFFEIDANKLWVYNGTGWVGTVLS